MSRTTYNSILLQDRMRELVKRIGNVRDTAKVLEVDPGYVSRLCNGGKLNPNDSILKRLGLVRTVAYVDDGSER